VDDDIEQEEPPSKSARKREMTALQKMGEELVGLSERELARMPLDDDRLQHAVHEARRIRSNSGRRRQLQYIGKLMRTIDPQPLTDALNALHQNHQQETDAFHQIEIHRNQLLAGTNEAIEAMLVEYPQADRQQLRQLVKQHQKEERANKAGAASKKLFRYLRDLAENH
jgi:ribosome-associated protein